MKRIIIITIAMLLGTVAAQAGQTDTYHDLIRPNGKMRSDAVHEADLNFCYQQTDQSRFLPDGAAFKKCMTGRGYRFTGLTGSASSGRDKSGGNPSFDSDGYYIGFPWDVDESGVQ